MRKIWMMLRNLPATIANKLLLRRKGVEAGQGLCINGRLGIHGNGKLVIGRNVTIHSCEDVNPAAGGVRTHLTAGTNAVLKIGDGCGLSHCAITAMQSVVIENDVLIGSNTMIADTDFHSVVFEERVTGNDSTAKTAPVVIREGAFIGARCIILKGVTIGKRAVVGAGSVVTKSIPDGEIWAGNPAKPLHRK